MPRKCWRRSDGRSANLPDNVGDTTKDQKAFLNQSVAGLAEEGKIISVRLALFAEMVKGKPWTPATLKEVGGTEGCRCHVSRRDLQCVDSSSRASLSPESGPGGSESLLPETGTDIKGR